MWKLILARGRRPDLDQGRRLGSQNDFKSPPFKSILKLLLPRGRPPDLGQNRLEPKTAPNHYFGNHLGAMFGSRSAASPDLGQGRLKPKLLQIITFEDVHFGSYFRLAVGRLIWARAAWTQKLLQIVSFEYGLEALFCSRSAAKSEPGPPGVKQ